MDNLPSSSTDTSVTVKTEENDVIIESDDNDGSSKQDIDESKIWKEKPADSSEKSREQEFEEYLADLFMWINIFISSTIQTISLFTSIISK